MLQRDTDQGVGEDPKRRMRRADRRSRPLSHLQERVFLGVVFAVGLLMNLAVILKMSAIIG